MSNAKVLSLSQLKAKKYTLLEHMPEDVKRSFGELTNNFTMLVYGKSSNGKSNLLLTLIKVLALNGKCLYISLEEGFEKSMQNLANRHLTDEYNGKIVFTNHTMTYDNLIKRLRTQRKEQFIFIDSIQYWNITYEQYCRLKEMFPKKAFIIISHKEGKDPKGGVAKAILFDVPVKVDVDRFVAIIGSRFGGNEPFVIWEEGARRRWGDKEFEKLTGIKKAKKTTNKNEKVHKSNEKNTTNDSGNTGGDSHTLQFGGDASTDRLSADAVECGADTMD
jgi:hypothetical protein